MQLSFRSINSAKTAFQICDIKSSFFASYESQQDVYHCKLSAKDFAAAFQAPKNLRQLNLEFDHQASELNITLTLFSDVQKSFRLGFIEGDIMSVGFSKDQCKYVVCSRPNMLADVLQTMRQDELRILFTNDQVEVSLPAMLTSLL
eukprot:COSAG05_NODE_41_length_26845_cov_26.599230_21_plen_146_part_00